MLKLDKGKIRREFQCLSWPRHDINIKRVPWMPPFLVFSYKERLAHQGIWFSQKWVISSKQMLIGKTLSPVLHRKLDSTIKCGCFFFPDYKNMWLLPESEHCSYKRISCSLQRKNIGKWVGTGKPAIREAPIMSYSCPAGGCNFPGKKNISIYIKQNLPPYFLRPCKWILFLISSGAISPRKALVFFWLSCLAQKGTSSTLTRGCKHCAVL